MSRSWPVLLLLVALAVLPAGAQSSGPLPHALQLMLDADRAFAARSAEAGWKAAFMEYLAVEAIGFSRGTVGFARDQIAAAPDPPADMRVTWEARYGDVSASGELGYLTGPVQYLHASRSGGRPRHAVYFSIWKQERDGTFKVLFDIGVPTPAAAVFAPGFTRAPAVNRFTGDYDERTPPLATADQILNLDLRASQARAYRDRLAPGARLYRPNMQPIVGERAILNWLAGQRPFASLSGHDAEAARSGDLGYTWGSYTVPEARGGQRGFYVRVWVRERTGQWRIAADILQPGESAAAGR